MSLTVKRPITVKAVVTEALVRDTVAELQDGIKKVEMELQQLDRYGRQMLTEAARGNPAQLADIRQQLEAEKRKREETKSTLLERIKEIGRPFV